jgi:hypothetical protein
VLENVLGFEKSIHLEEDVHVFKNYPWVKIGIFMSFNKIYA